MKVSTTKLIYLISVFTLSSTMKAFSCNCESEGTVTSSVKSADVVLSGQVISRTMTTNYDSLGITALGEDSLVSANWRKYPITVVRIKVEQVYKGKLVSDTISVFTSASASVCGYYFKIGQKYIVYGTSTDEMLGAGETKSQTMGNKVYWTNQCTRTQNWSASEENDILIETR